MELSQAEIDSTYEEFNLDPKRPIMLQVSRYDRFKDPLGVIEAYKLTKQSIPEIQLVLAGGGATDDPEGEEVLKKVRDSAGKDTDIHILLLPSDAHKTINALQRVSDIVLQKSLKEGFGLTVTEAMWKGKPVIGGNTGGIRLQIINHHTGFLVDSPEGAALRIQQLLQDPEKLRKMGRQAKEYVRENFLNTRHLREILSLFTALDNKSK
jgi:trehalose synthase